MCLCLCACVCVCVSDLGVGCRKLNKCHEWTGGPISKLEWVGVVHILCSVSALLDTGKIDNWVSEQKSSSYSVCLRVCMTCACVRVCVCECVCVCVCVIHPPPQKYATTKNPFMSFLSCQTPCFPAFLIKKSKVTMFTPWQCFSFVLRSAIHQKPHHAAAIVSVTETHTQCGPKQPWLIRGVQTQRNGPLNCNRLALNAWLPPWVPESQPVSKPSTPAPANKLTQEPSTSWECFVLMIKSPV